MGTLSLQIQCPGRDYYLPRLPFEDARWLAKQLEALHGEGRVWLFPCESREWVEAYEGQEEEE